MALRLADLAVRFGCELRGDPDIEIQHVATLRHADAGAITFLANPHYRKYLTDSEASAVVLDPESADQCPVAALVTDNPYLLYAKITTLLYPQPVVAPGIQPGAVVADDAMVAESAHIGANAVVAAGVVIGEHVVIGPGCVVQENAQLGDHCRLVASVTLCHGVALGKRVLIHPGVVVGADGFGIAQDENGWTKVPQVGSVRIGDDVEIGANTSIDRGAIDDTVIEDGVKLDNQIQVAHNVRIGAHTAIAGCVAIAGSADIGSRCMIGGGVGIVGHISIVDDVVITARTLVTHSIKQAGSYSGSLPMDETSRWRKNSARLRQLDNLARRVIALERAINSNKNGNHNDD